MPGTHSVCAAKTLYYSGHGLAAASSMLSMNCRPGSSIPSRACSTRCLAPQHLQLLPMPWCSLSCLPTTTALIRQYLKRKTKQQYIHFCPVLSHLKHIMGCSTWVSVEGISAGGQGKETVLDSKAVFIKDIEMSGYLGYLLTRNLN